MPSKKASLLYAIVLLLLLSGCFGKAQRKSADYYTRNAVALQAIRANFDSLYQVNPFSIGYTDKSFRYYFVEFTTDTVRWVYNNVYSPDSLANAMQRMGYPASQFKRLLVSMKEVQCLWLDKTKRYLEGQPVYFTYLSFGSALADKPFVENKYYVLIFPNGPQPKAALQRRAKSGGIIPINDSVFFTVSNRFR